MERFKIELESYYEERPYGFYRGWSVKLIRRDEFPEFYGMGSIAHQKENEDIAVKKVVDALKGNDKSMEVYKADENLWRVCSYYSIGD